MNISLNAAKYPYTTKCPQWELGDIVYYNGIQQNATGSTPPQEFCWDAVAIHGALFVNGSLLNTGEELISNESYYDWLAGYKHTVYGEEFWGTIFRVVVFGQALQTPIVTFNDVSGNLISSSDIKSPSGNTFNGKEFLFFVRHTTVASAVYISDLDIQGNLKVYDSGFNLKELTYIH